MLSIVFAIIAIIAIIVVIIVVCGHSSPAPLAAGIIVVEYQRSEAKNAIKAEKAAAAEESFRNDLNAR